ncbi:MAG TPA: fucose isomerase [Terracidiphilus sp.]|nr:fucose isomerase [Terracidiphilus sp.]
MAQPDHHAATPASDEVLLITSGDLRLSANQVCWPAQRDMEEKLTAAFARKGFKLVRAHAYDEKLKHGFISSQRQGMDVFMNIHPEARLVFATAAWQYSHHVLPGLRSHQGPILTVANWSGQWPGLVGLLNLNGSLIKAGKKFSSIWSKDFTDDYFLHGLEEWLSRGTITHDLSHVHALDRSKLPAEGAKMGAALAGEIRHRKAIMGIFDEGCMGMYNAIIDDELLNPAGIFKERLSQSALVAKMRTVSDAEAKAVYDWLVAKGVHFDLGKDPVTELTADQILGQCKMYIAAVRIASEFGCDAIGIQYQQGLKDMAPASDLAEGMLNNADRPPVYAEGTNRELYAGRPLPHFNEVDECAGVDVLITNRCWSALGYDPSTTLHDVRWGEHYKGDGIDDFVWLLQISGAAPANHFVDGYAGAKSERQPAMYFPLGGGSLKGVGRPGEIVWSRVFVEGGALHVDMGRGTVVTLPESETERRWRETTVQWPIVHTILHGVSQNQMMARHRANHVNVAYAPTAEEADKALATKAALFAELGVQVHLCGVSEAGSRGAKAAAEMAHSR